MVGLGRYCSSPMISSTTGFTAQTMKYDCSGPVMCRTIPPLKMNFATALSDKEWANVVHKYLFWVPLPLLGFDALMIFTVMASQLVLPVLGARRVD